MENQKLKDQNKVLENLCLLQSEQVEKLEAKAEKLDKLVAKLWEIAADNEKVLDNLRNTVEKDATKISALQREVRELKAEAAQEDEVIEKLSKEADEDRKAKAQEAELMEAMDAPNIAGNSGAGSTDQANNEDPKALVVARPVLDVPPMNIGCEGVIVPESAWERYSLAHPGLVVWFESDHGSGRRIFAVHLGFGLGDHDHDRGLGLGLCLFCYSDLLYARVGRRFGFGLLGMGS
ncbi:hypothetical protein C2845_PM11G07520 [Panicum miliaceum]|uniref:Uncharacterized protein n=1 Tax=Panicum miliaceum TaxID=4540 RepID=A0A3L6RUR2_PANMI|nr:hypothetical protein C2845_PM11G07520 [Panicum miliaceum]